ncbi:hypothetical protein LPB140_05980 [Sphingorhabdus lutea]|uniref:Uncharacterized protein n=1 Tax=Sphingorhabdus lutea TaxID=1913578 RepID=A0A1L3JBC4_9SPHN|nr:hypothetical protein [Sphingorhabdus lutea]APG62418.1 hypothetical protein LPB140_05980 [Sphingorhabdus lutea]
MALFENKIQAQSDEREISRILIKYGAEAKSILVNRSKDKDFSIRTRKHWKRLAKKLSKMPKQMSEMKVN